MRTRNTEERQKGGEKQKKRQEKQKAKKAKHKAKGAKRDASRGPFSIPKRDLEGSKTKYDEICRINCLDPRGNPFK